MPTGRRRHGCTAGSLQDLWLEADLAANSTENVIAVWHRPRYSSGVTNYQTMQPLWDDLYAAGVDIALVGHDHHYERFAPIKSGATPASQPVVDLTYGLREFVVGTGGAAASGYSTILTASEARSTASTYGVLKLTLHASTYDWKFLPIAAGTYTDSGTGSVHAAPPASNNAPVAVADSYSTPQNTGLTVTAPGVLTNDTDADSNPLTAILDANVTHGTLALNANGGFTYTPTAGYTGPDSFTYHANDGTANSNIVTVSLTVTVPATPRGWWTMDGNVLDSSGNNNNGTPQGAPTFVAGRVGQAISLNGTTQWVSVADANSLDLTTGMTLSAWIRPAVTVNTTQDLIKKASTTGTAVNGYELSLSAAGKVFVRFNQASSGDTFRINSATDYPLNDTAWMHVAATYDGTTMRLYINGVQRDRRGGTGRHHGQHPAAIARRPERQHPLVHGPARRRPRVCECVVRLGDRGAGRRRGPPNAPTLNAPTNGSSGAVTSPTLSVGVSDPDANPLTVTYFGRPYASGNFAQIAQNTGVASGTNSTTTWSNIGAGQRFEWYVTVNDGTTTTTGPTWTFNTAASADPVFVGTGDIASCAVTTDNDTGNLIDGIQGAIWTTGDNVYPNGTAAEFTNCYAPTPWGSTPIKSRTRPVPGNHDWGAGVTNSLAGYFGYFGANATDAGGKRYYSYDIAGSNWHVVNLDSECTLFDGGNGCAAGSPQEVWLEADLAANSTKNVIAIWHKPRYSSGATDQQNMQPLWDDLYAAGVDILLDGHDHIYERTVPMKSGAALADPPVADPTYGIRQFTVGTGGEAHHGLGTLLPTSAVSNDETFGILKLTLHATTYDWVFLPIAGEHVHRLRHGHRARGARVRQHRPGGRGRQLQHAPEHAVDGSRPGRPHQRHRCRQQPADGGPRIPTASNGSLTLNPNGSFTFTPTAGYTGPSSFTYHANDGTANSNIVTVSLTVTLHHAARLVDHGRQCARQFRQQQQRDSAGGADLRGRPSRPGHLAQRHQPVGERGRRQQPRPDYRADPVGLDPAGCHREHDPGCPEEGYERLDQWL